MEKKKIFGNPHDFLLFAGKEIDCHVKRFEGPEIFDYTEADFGSIQKTALCALQELAFLGFECMFSCFQYHSEVLGKVVRQFLVSVRTPSGNNFGARFKKEIVVNTATVDDQGKAFFEFLDEVRRYIKKNTNEMGMLDLEF